MRAGPSTDPSSTPTEGRVYFRNIEPYAIVDSLDQLRGPAGGTVVLSHSVLWAPGGPEVDVDEPGGTGLAYRAVLNEGPSRTWCRSSTALASSTCGRT